MPDSTPTPNPSGIEIKPVPTPEQKKILTPEEKAALKKQSRKRLALFSASLYTLLLLFTIVWALVVGATPFSLFNYLPISQLQFNWFVMVIFNVLLGIVVVGALLSALFFMFKALFMKKEKVDEKKKATKHGLFSGLAFFLLAILWLVGIWFLGPKLILEERYESAILTDPEVIIGLTAPIDVTFDASAIPLDSKVYQVLSYSWDFGDGGEGNGQIVSHRYVEKADKDGLYTVTLSVNYMNIKSGELLEAEFSTEVGIKNELVAADFSMDPDKGGAPLTVNFDASKSSDPDGEIVSYEWDMDGDGRFDDEEGETVDYTFEQEGDYEISLRVTDNNGEYDVVTKTLQVGVQGLQAVITSTVPEGQKYFVNEKYSFTADQSKSDDSAIGKYTWDFGDGSTAQSRSTNHTYTETGVYEILLTVADANGETDTASLIVEVVDPGSKPQAVITSTPSAKSGTIEGSVPLTIDFDASNSLDPDDDLVDYAWDFDNDGTLDDRGEAVKYTYQEVGNYEARLLVTDAEGHEAETLVNVKVTEQGIIARLETDLSNGEVPLVVRFDASGSTYQEGSILSYEYDFGDGSDGHVGGSSVSYRYTSVGTFTATVTVIGNDGTRDTASVQVVVRPVALTACFNLNVDSGKAPLYVTVQPSCSQGTIQSYEWNFGDGDVSFDRQPEAHLYEEPGTYTITLEVTGDNGIVDNFEQEITVN